MIATPTSRKFDLEDRTLCFAKEVILFVRSLPRSIPNHEISKQLVRAAGSVGANYIEANEALGKKDFCMKVRISRREAKESRYWLQLVECGEEDQTARKKLIQEATELMKIFGAILRNSERANTNS
jgi:four helix bundle protein